MKEEEFLCSFLSSSSSSSASSNQISGSKEVRLVSGVNSTFFFFFLSLYEIVEKYSHQDMKENGGMSNNLET